MSLSSKKIVLLASLLANIPLTTQAATATAQRLPYVDDMFVIAKASCAMMIIYMQANPELREDTGLSREQLIEGDKLIPKILTHWHTLRLDPKLASDFNALDKALEHNLRCYKNSAAARQDLGKDPEIINFLANASKELMEIRSSATITGKQAITFLYKMHELNALITSKLKNRPEHAKFLEMFKKAVSSIEKLIYENNNFFEALIGKNNPTLQALSKRLEELVDIMTTHKAKKLATAQPASA